MSDTPERDALAALRETLLESRQRGFIGTAWETPLDDYGKRVVDEVLRLADNAVARGVLGAIDRDALAVELGRHSYIAPNPSERVSRRTAWCQCGGWHTESVEGTWYAWRAHFADSVLLGGVRLPADEDYVTPAPPDCRTAEPAPSDGERERPSKRRGPLPDPVDMWDVALAEYRDSPRYDARAEAPAWVHAGQAMKAALLRQPGAPEADECVRCGAATCRGAKLATVCEDCRAAPPREPSEAAIGEAVRRAWDERSRFWPPEIFASRDHQDVLVGHIAFRVAELFGAARGAPQEGGGA